MHCSIKPLPVYVAFGTNIRLHIGAETQQYPCRDVARHGLGGKWPPSPPNEMKPISPFGLGLMFFDRFHII